MSEFSARTEDEVLGPAEPHGGEEGVTDPESDADAASAQTPADGGPEESPRKGDDDYLALAQRTQADFENYRKRTQRELDGARARGIARLAGELLPTLDNLERALDAARDAASVDQQLIEGLLLVQRELLAALERAGIERYGEPGDGFDPGLHEAVAHQPVDGAAAGEIVEVYQPGYRIGGSVIRPARVLVAA
jgi:molecular chaperone GrpE